MHLNSRISAITILSVLMAGSVTTASLAKKVSLSASTQDQYTSIVKNISTSSSKSEIEIAQLPTQLGSDSVEKLPDAITNANEQDLTEEGLADEELADEKLPDNVTPDSAPGDGQDLLEGLADEELPANSIPEEVTQPESKDNAKSLSNSTNLMAKASAPRRFRALQLSKKHIGYTTKLGNCSKFSTYFGKGCQAWCADFVSSMLDSVGNRNKQLPWNNPSTVASILAWGRKVNQVVKQPAPGDLFIMQARGQSHVGFVESVKGHIFYTVEGNTSKPNNKNVRGVFRKARDIRKFPFIFVRVPARTQT